MRTGVLDYHSLFFKGFVVISLMLLVPCAVTAATSEVSYLTSSTLSIGSTPSGAAVTINGVSAGTTPLNNLNLIPATAYTIVLTLSGYQDYSATLTLVNGENRAVSYTLVPKTAEYVIAQRYVKSNTTAIPVVANGGTTPVPVRYQVPVQQNAVVITTTPVVLQRVEPQKPAATPGVSGTPPGPATPLPTQPVPTPLATPPLQTNVPLMSEAKGSQPEGLPLSPLIPDRLALLAAMIVGAGVAALAAFMDTPAGTRLRKPVEKTKTFVQNLVPGELVGLMSVTEAKKRGLTPSAESQKYKYLLSLHEWLVVGIAALGFTVAFIIQNRLAIEMTKFIIFLCMGACVVILHDIGHRIMANRIGRTAEVQFWGLGFLTMLATAWLFGNAFAKPSRAIIGGGSNADAKSGAIIQAAGPAVNLIAAGLSLLLIPLGGFFAIAGSAGFTMNLLSCVYSLLPVNPMEGKAIWDWNRLAWAVLCLPLILGYAAVYLFF
jgi:Zn-dependent protease